jgi:hypothetical protein
MRSFALSVLAVTGCSQILGIGDLHSSSSATDAGHDSGPADACVQFSSLIDTCAQPFGSAIYITGSATYTTDSHVLDVDGMTIMTSHVLVQAAGAEPIDIVLADSFAIEPGATLTVSGSNAFGVVAPHAIDIEGLLDASVGGAGSRGSDGCGTQAGAIGITVGDNGAGGGGAGMQGNGGSGVATNTAAASAGGVPATCPLSPLGGCPGGGGGGSAMLGLSHGGPGGGAVYVASGIGITVGASGGINVGGGGGTAGEPLGGGGGGGGAGGSIILEAATLTVTGTMAANGGGGGGAGGTDLNAMAVAGSDGQLGALAAKGGSSTQGSGGDGGWRDMPDGAPSASTSKNSGGGGGGVGYIILLGTLAPDAGSSSFSPSPLPHCP